MTIQFYARVLRQQWLVVLIGITFGLAAGVTLFLARPPEYTARLTMYVSSQAEDNTDAAYEGALLSQHRVTSYVELVSSRRVVDEVISRLNLATRPNALAHQISATSTVDSVLIDVWVVDQDPVHASRIANTVGAVFTGLVDEIERPINPDSPRPVAVRVVQPAVVPEVPSSAGLLLILPQGFILGLVLGIACAFVRSASDSSLNAPSESSKEDNAYSHDGLASTTAVPQPSEAFNSASPPHSNGA